MHICFDIRQVVVLEGGCVFLLIWGCVSGFWGLGFLLDCGFACVTLFPWLLVGRGVVVVCFLGDFWVFMAMLNWGVGVSD